MMTAEAAAADMAALHTPHSGCIPAYIERLARPSELKDGQRLGLFAAAAGEWCE